MEASRGVIRCGRGQEEMKYFVDDFLTSPICREASDFLMQCSAIRIVKCIRSCQFLSVSALLYSKLRQPQEPFIANLNFPL